MANMKYLLNRRSFIPLMVLFSFIDNFGMEAEEARYGFKVLFVGDAGVGKTQILNKFVNNKFAGAHDLTLGVEMYSKLIKIHETKIKLQFWVCGGSLKYRSIIRSYYQNSRLIVLVYAVDDVDSFKHIREWVADVKAQTDENAKFLLVGNKCDLKEKRQVAVVEAQQYAKDNNMEFIEVSAKDGFNINIMFDSSLSKLLKYMEVEEKKKEEIQFENHDKNIDIKHINNNLSFCNKYCSCCPCL